MRDHGPRPVAALRRVGGMKGRILVGLFGQERPQAILEVGRETCSSTHNASILSLEDPDDDDDQERETHTQTQAENTTTII